MNTTLKRVMVGTGIVAAVVLGFASMQPDEFKVTRSTNISAPSTDVYSQVSDFRHWEKWSPWAKLDPEMKTFFDGPASGEGAVYGWSGNSKVGEGKMTIVKNQPNDLLMIQLDFERPMKASNMTEFTFQPSGPETLVTWTMSGRNNFFSKVISMFMSMDKVIGPDFEKGLAQLKTVVESQKTAETPTETL